MGAKGWHGFLDIRLGQWRDALENDTKSVVGVNGIYTYTPDFHGSTSLEGLAVLRVTDGKFEVVKTY